MPVGSQHPHAFQVYNTLTRQKMPFIPVKEGHVKMYVCGVTPYDHSHIGHARVYVVFDTLYRFLKENGWQVIYARNFTDVDDKIINRAKETGQNPVALAAQFIESYRADMARLHVLTPEVEPKVSDHIPEIITLIEALVANGRAYVTSAQDVVFNIATFPTYGALSGKKLDELQAGARVGVDHEKQNPADFVLWKAAKEGEISWDSPWGKGRPGWHIECSAMSSKYLGETFDIHGGGEDLQFPHHENEIAQSEGAHCCRYVNYWMHNGFITVNGEKMAKSAGNFTLIRDVLEHISGEALRYYILNAHYRRPVDFTEEAMQSAARVMERFYRALEKAEQGGLQPAAAKPAAMEAFNACLADDLNTPKALALLHEELKQLNTALADKNTQAIQDAAATLYAMGGLLGLFQEQPAHYLQSQRSTGGDAPSDAAIDALVQARNEARACRDFAKADALRDTLTGLGIVLEDTATGTAWHRS